MTWPTAVDAQGWMRKTERRIGLLERKPVGGGTGGGGTPSGNPLLPIGSIVEWAGSALPAGYLWCDGSAVSRTTYAALFAAIGTTYGVGDNSTTFNLPNRKGKVGVGRDAAQTEFDVLGETGGAKTHTLTIAEMPAHTHQQIMGQNAGTILTAQIVANLATYGLAQTTGSTGGGQAHSNLQPYVVVNYVINATNLSSGGGGGATEITVQDTATLDLTLTGSPAVGYTLKGDVVGGGGTPLAVVDTPTLDLTLTGDKTSGYTIKGDVLGNTPAPLPAGSIIPWSGTGAVPAGYLLADGSAVSRTLYADLFAAIGTTYGVGDNSTTFNLPNYKGRVAVGQDSTQTEFDALGETGGAKAHTLTIAEMPAHTHVQNAHNHIQDAHNHTAYEAVGYAVGGSSFALWPSVTGTPKSTAIASVIATNQAATATNQNTGGGGAHNNLQPYLVQRFLISIGGGSLGAGSRGVVGEIITWPGVGVPEDFLLCNGQAVSRTVYAALYQILGVNFGVGDNSTTFNLPDYRGRVGVGVDAAQPEFLQINKTGGAKTHTLTVAEMPSHTHGVYSGVNSPYTVPQGSFYGLAVLGQLTSDPAGGGGAHNNLQPYLSLNYMIRYRTSLGANDTKLAVTDTATIDLTLTGTGSTPDPFTIKADVKGTWTGFTPVLKGSVTNPNLGSTGSGSGEYIVIAGICHWRASFGSSGTGISAGSGDYTVAPPVAPRGGFPIVGQGWIYGTAGFKPFIMDGSNGRLIRTDNGLYVTDAIGLSTSGHVLTLAGSYQV